MQRNACCIKYKCPARSFTQALLDAPKEQFAKRFQRDLACPVLSRKIIRFRRRANHLTDSPVSPERGAARDRHERAVGCDGRDSVGRAMGSQGGSSRERSAGARTNGAANRLRQNSPDRTRPGKTFGVRWARTAKSCGPGAPMLASSLAEMHPAQPGLRCIVNPQGDGGKKARSPGRARSKP
jgi:hypothetical protein